MFPFRSFPFKSWLGRWRVVSSDLPPVFLVGKGKQVILYPTITFNNWNSDYLLLAIPLQEQVILEATANGVYDR